MGRPAGTEDFSLFLGGPVYQLLLRVGLIKPPLDRLKWRILVLVSVVWAPLLLLTVLDGRFLGGVKTPFLLDYEVQARLLACLPLMIAAEVTTHRFTIAIVRQFRERQLIVGPAEARFQELTESAKRIRNSTPLEVGLFILVFVIGRILWQEIAALQSDTWYATLLPGARTSTPAGIWYQYVSLPISQFIWMRWMVRLFIWWRFLWQVSRLDLNLVPTHPDRACGLGFLDGSIFLTAPFLLTQSCMLSGYVANRVLYEGARLPEYYAEIGVLAAYLVVLALGPLCAFTPALLRARISGLLLYGKLASEYVIAFDRKWIGGPRPPDELVGSADVQSLADLASSYDIVKSIFPVPFGRSSLVGLVIVIALPLLPLTLTMFSLQDLVMRLVKVVF